MLYLEASSTDPPFQLRPDTIVKHDLFYLESPPFIFSDSGLKTWPAVHDPRILDGHHVSGLHLQANVVLLRVHQVVKRPHRSVQLLHLKMALVHLGNSGQWGTVLLGHPTWVHRALWSPGRWEHPSGNHGQSGTSWVGSTHRAHHAWKFVFSASGLVECLNLKPLGIV